MPVISVVYGSASDKDIMQEALAVLEEFGVEYEHMVLSAHRQPEETVHFAKTAASRGVKVIIAGAGLSAALPGVIASHTTLPVIGVPISAGPLNGVDALYSIVQMPKGIPVAAVGISNSKNAGLLSLQILAVADENLAAKIADYRRKSRS